MSQPASQKKPLSEPRTPQEYLARLEASSLRRIGGGLLSLDRRGQAAFGATWRPLSVALSALAAAAGWRGLRSLGNSVAPMLSSALLWARGRGPRLF